MNQVSLQIPNQIEQLVALQTSQWVELSGNLITARDAALKRIVTLIQTKTPLPVELKGQVIYFMGPTPAAPGFAMGAAGPTTSRRMEGYLPYLLEAGIRAVIGKGPLSANSVALFQKHQAVYLAAVGGAGALYGSRVQQAKLVAYPELGPEAIYALQVEKFPALIGIDLHGNNLFYQGAQASRKE